MENLSGQIKRRHKAMKIEKQTFLAIIGMDGKGRNFCKKLLLLWNGANYMTVIVVWYLWTFWNYIQNSCKMLRCWDHTCLKFPVSGFLSIDFVLLHVEKKRIKLTRLSLIQGIRSFLGGHSDHLSRPLQSYSWRSYHRFQWVWWWSENKYRRTIISKNYISQLYKNYQPR